jgi:undecaprenyl-diphosphatase
MLALLIAIVVGWGLILTDVLLPGSLARWDHDMVRWFVDHRTAERTDLSYVATMLADTVTVLGISLLVIIILGFRKLWRLAGLLAFGLLLEVATYGAGSVLAPRLRPPFQRLEVLTENTSYPSGHTAAAVVVYFCIAILVTSFTKNRWARALAWTVAAIAPVLVGVSRLYRAMHYPTDIATGFVMGILCVIAAVFIVRVTGVVEEAHEARQASA